MVLDIVNPHFKSVFDNFLGTPLVPRLEFGFKATGVKIVAVACLEINPILKIGVNSFDETRAETVERLVEQTPCRLLDHRKPRRRTTYCTTPSSITLFGIAGLNRASRSVGRLTRRI